MANESNFNEKPNREKNISSMTIEIEPIDPLFFRDGRPFGGPGDHWADSLGLPLPSTIYGALLGKYVSGNYSVEKLEELRKKRGKIESNLEIEFIYFIEENTSDREYEEIKIPLFPVPLDVVKEKEGEEIKVLNWENNLFTNNNNSLIPIAPEGVEVEGLESNFFLREEDLKDYLDGEEELSVEKFEFKTEPKIGIGLNKKRKAVEESKIYRVGFKRYEKFGDGTVEKLKIRVKFKGLNIPGEGILKLGGEGRSTKYKRIETKLEILSETVKLEGEGFFKFYLTTPAIFEKGWIPDFLEKKNGKLRGTLCLEKEDGEKVEVEVSLKGAVIGKPIYVGGWDMVAGIPKPMFRAVPAGSVYLFEYKLHSPVEVKRVQKMLFNPSQSELSERFKKEGFGIGILTTTKIKKKKLFKKIFTKRSKKMKIITPVGTSLLENMKESEKNKIKGELQRIKGKSYHRDFKEKGRFDKEIRRIFSYLIGQEKEDKIQKSSHIFKKLEDPSISAEISVIDKLVKLYFPNSQVEVENDKSNSPQESNPPQGNLKLEVHLFPSDSLEGYICAKAIEFYIRNKEDWEGKIKVENHEPVKDLRIDSKEEFEEGIEKFINEIIEVVKVEGDFSFDNVIFNITGSYKAIIAYLATLSQITQIPMYYLFEKSDEILELPTLPVGFDDKKVGLYLPILKPFILRQLSKSKEKRDIEILEELEKAFLIKRIGEEVKIRALGQLLKEKEKHVSQSFGHLMELVIKAKLEKTKEYEECKIKTNIKKGMRDDKEIDILVNCCNRTIEIWEVKDLGQITKFFAGKTKDGKQKEPQFKEYIRYLEKQDIPNKKLILLVYLLETSLTKSLIAGALSNPKFDFKKIIQEIEEKGIKLEIKYAEISRELVKKSILIQNLHQLKIKAFDFNNNLGKE